MDHPLDQACETSKPVLRRAMVSAMTSGEAWGRAKYWFQLTMVPRAGRQLSWYSMPRLVAEALLRRS